MKYKKAIKHFNNGTIDRTKVQLIMDNDDGYWLCIDDMASDDERTKIECDLTARYGTPEGYRDIVDALNAAGVNCDWC